MADVDKMEAELHENEVGVIVPGSCETTRSEGSMRDSVEAEKQKMAFPSVSCPDGTGGAKRASSGNSETEEAFRKLCTTNVSGQMFLVMAPESPNGDGPTAAKQASGRSGTASQSSAPPAISASGRTSPTDSISRTVFPKTKAPAASSETTGGGGPDTVYPMQLFRNSAFGTTIKNHALARPAPRKPADPVPSTKGVTTTTFTANNMVTTTTFQIPIADLKKVFPLDPQAIPQISALSEPASSMGKVTIRLQKAAESLPVGAKLEAERGGRDGVGSKSAAVQTDYSAENFGDPCRPGETKAAASASAETAKGPSEVRSDCDVARTREEKGTGAEVDPPLSLKIDSVFSLRWNAEEEDEKDDVVGHHPDDQYSPRSPQNRPPDAAVEEKDAPAANSSPTRRERDKKKVRNKKGTFVDEAKTKLSNEVQQSLKDSILRKTGTGSKKNVATGPGCCPCSVELCKMNIGSESVKIKSDGVSLVKTSESVVGCPSGVRKTTLKGKLVHATRRRSKKDHASKLANRATADCVGKDKRVMPERRIVDKSADASPSMLAALLPGPTKFLLVKVDGKNLLLPVVNNELQPRAYILNGEKYSFSASPKRKGSPRAIFKRPLRSLLSPKLDNITWAQLSSMDADGARNKFASPVERCTVEPGVGSASAEKAMKGKTGKTSASRKRLRGRRTRESDESAAGKDDDSAAAKLLKTEPRTESKEVADWGFGAVRSAQRSDSEERIEKLKKILREKEEALENARRALITGSART